MWVKQDGAKCYTAEATFDVLGLVYEDRIISSRADVVWKILLVATDEFSIKTSFRKSLLTVPLVAIVVAL